MPVNLKRIMKFLAAVFTLGLLFLISTLWYFSTDLPDYKILANYKPPISSRVHSGEGQLIAEYALQKRLFIPYDFVPKNVIYSFLSAEDKNFFSHPGIDAKSITRAIIKNIKNIFSEKRLEGASTITQQVAKNFLLTNEVSINRKFFATCCVIVDAPSNLFSEKIFFTFLIIARVILFASIPG